MTFDRQPNLIGELVSIRPLQESDLEALYAVACDPMLWEQHPARDRYKRSVFEVLFQESLASGGALLVSDTASGNAIGSSRYHGYNESASEIEIGWTFLRRTHWGGRYNGELKQLMLRHAFRFVSSVVFLVGPNNTRSQRAVERIGATRDGVRVDGTGFESYLYRINANAFRDSRP
ncbi:MAG: GNAT family N-acetyltransferase [Planctomycetota bacterium]